MIQGILLLLSQLLSRTLGASVGGGLLAWLFIILGIICLAIGIRSYCVYRRTRSPSDRPWGQILVGSVLIAVALGIWFLPDFRTPEERALAAITNRGGQVTWADDSQKQPGMRVSFREPGRWQSRLTDRDLAELRPHLEALPNLQHLDLTQTFITDNGLAELECLTKLKTLSLGWCEGNDLRRGEGPDFSSSKLKALTATGVDELRSALPNTRVSFCPPAMPAVRFSPEAMKRIGEASQIK